MNARLTLPFALVAALVVAGWMALPRYTFAPGSRVWVEGTSTIHDWECTTGQVSATLDATPSGNGLTAISALNISTPASALDCGNGTMNGKARDALGSSPIRFTLSDARVGSPNAGHSLVEGTGQLTIHGTTRSQRIQARGQALSNGRFRFTGEVQVTMSQFGVAPPRAMAGTLRTGDQVTVKFDVTATR